MTAPGIMRVGAIIIGSKARRLSGDAKLTK